MLSKDEVLKIARLARLELTENEVAEYQRRLGRVLEYMKDLEGLSAPAEEAVHHVPIDAVNFREDAAQEFTDCETLIANAPLSEQGLFLIPTVVDKDL